MLLGHSCMIGSSSLSVTDLGVALEARGFESLWLGEHPHLPVDSTIDAAHQGPHGSEPVAPPEPYRHMPDPIVSLAAVATATSSLRLGLGVLLALERHPLIVAKELATLDRLSAGRLVVGLGVGWNRRELANHTTIPWNERYQALEEYAVVLRRIWSDDVVEHHGRYFDLDPLWSYPKPVAPGGPPLLVGAVGPIGMSHAARWADGWLPADDRIDDLDAAYRSFVFSLERHGRDRAAVSVTLNVRLRRDRDGHLPGTDLLLRCRDLGVDRAVLIDSPHEILAPDDRLRMLDRYASVIDRL